MAISRRSFLQAATASAAASTFPVAGRAALREHSAGKPNVVIIFSDDQGYGDLGCYGSEFPTPHIDGIAESGVRFTDFYSAGPVCTPSRFSLMTGSYPSRSLHGLDGVIMPESDYHLDPCETTIARRFQQHGYKTGLFGKWHLGHASEGHRPHNHGFDTFSGFLGGCIDYWRHTYGILGPDWFVDNQPAAEEGYATDLITNHAINFIDSRSRDQAPFFLMLGYNAPHYGKTDPGDIPDNTLVVHSYAGNHNTLQAPAEYLDRFAHLGDERRRYYAAMVANMDDNIGRFLERLATNGQLGNTILWFISDNGATTEYGGSNGPLRDEKASVYEGGIRVPAMVSWPGKLPAGSLCPTPLAALDLVPTLATLTGYSLAGGRPIDGIDTSGVLLNDDPIERDLFWDYKDGQAFRRGKWKLCQDQLFDLSTDAKEQNDLSSRHSAMYDELRQAFADTRQLMALYPTECRTCGSIDDGELIGEVVAVGSSLCYQLDTVSVGTALYTDRDYTFAAPLPDGIAGLPFVRTANDDKYNTAPRLLELRVERPVTLYLLIDSQGDGRAAWMRGFERTDLRIETSAPFSYQVFRRDYQAGEIVLGGNMDRGNTGAKNNYLVAALETTVTRGRVRRPGPQAVPLHLALNRTRKELYLRLRDTNASCRADIISPTGKLIDTVRLENGAGRWGCRGVSAGFYVVRARLRGGWFTRRIYLQ